MTASQLGALKYYTLKVTNNQPAEQALFSPRGFSGERNPGASAELARAEQDTRNGKMLPPCVSRDYSAPQSLRAGLRSSVKREKISPVLQTTYNSQMWPGRLEKISFDRVSSMRIAKIPHPLVRNPPLKKNSWIRPCR